MLVLGESTSLYVFGNLFGLPRDSFVAQAAWGSLGHETGCALGVALGSGKRPCVVAGDGGFMMICQELSSLVARRGQRRRLRDEQQGLCDRAGVRGHRGLHARGRVRAVRRAAGWDYRGAGHRRSAPGAIASRPSTELAAVLAEVKDLEGVPALVEVVIPQKDLAPQLDRLAAPPPPLRKYGRTPIPNGE